MTRYSVTAIVLSLAGITLALLWWLAILCPRCFDREEA